VRCCQTALARRLDVVVTDLSRLSRSQGDLSKMIDRLVVKGIRVVACRTVTCSDAAAIRDVGVSLGLPVLPS